MVVYGRRGYIDPLYFRMSEVILALLVFMALMIYISNVSSDSLFEQNFLARDLALTLDSIYSAPGNVSLVYDTAVEENKQFFVVRRITFFPETKLRFAFGDSRVNVFRDSIGEVYQNPAVYFFGTDKNTQFIPPLGASETDLERNSQGFTIPNTKSDISFHKSQDEISAQFVEVEEHEFEEVKNE